MSGALEEHGEAIVKDFNNIVAYHITNVGGEDRAVTILIDMRNHYGNQGGMCVLREGLCDLKADQKSTIFCD